MYYSGLIYSSKSDLEVVLCFPAPADKKEKESNWDMDVSEGTDASGMFTAFITVWIVL